MLWLPKRVVPGTMPTPTAAGGVVTASGKFRGPSLIHVSMYSTSPYRRGALLHTSPGSGRQSTPGRRPVDPPDRPRSTTDGGASGLLGSRTGDPTEMLARPGG